MTATLTDTGGTWTSELTSFDRMLGRVESTVIVGRDAPHHIRIAVRNFNELAESAYDGYAFTRGRRGFAGLGWWKGIPFGFFAWRQPPYLLGPYRPDEITPRHLLGTYELLCDGLYGLLALYRLEGDEVHGELREPAGAVHPVTATLDAEIRHRVRIAVGGDLPPRPPVLDVLMFSHSFTGMAGTLAWGGQPLGCALVRTGWPAG